MVNGEVHVHIGIAHIGALHVLKELFAKVVCERVHTMRQALEGELKFGEFTHNKRCLNRITPPAGNPPPTACWWKNFAKL